MAKQKGIHLTREGKRPDTGLKYLSAGNATPGLTWARLSPATQCTTSLWGVGIAGCAATYSGIGAVLSSIEKRHVFWYATCMVTELRA